VADTKTMRPAGAGPTDGSVAPAKGRARTRCGIVACAVLKLPSRSMSMTDLNALGDILDSGTTKLPAAPALGAGTERQRGDARCIDSSGSGEEEREEGRPRGKMGTALSLTAAEPSYMTKSIPPSSATHLSTALLTESNYRKQ
jgi:hypothetical protein